MYDETTGLSIDYLLVATELEMARQNEKWGEQNHPLMPKDTVRPTFQSIYATYADQWKKMNADRAEYDRLGWDGILLEEVYEALSDTDVDNQIAELIQVAAVALQAAASLQRNRK